MKRLFYVLIFTCIYANLNAQSVDFETTLRSHFYSQPMDIMSFGSIDIAVSREGGCHHPYTGESIRLASVYYTGDQGVSLNYTHPILTELCIHNINAVWGTDNSIYLHIYGSDCDYFLSLLIVKLDGMGNTIWEKTNDELPVSYFGKESIKAAPDGGLWVLSSQGLVRLDAAGDIAQLIPQNIKAFDYELATNELVYLQRMGNDYELVYVDAAANTHTFPSTYSVKDVYLTGDNILTQSSSILSLIDKQGNELNPAFSLSSAKLLEVTDQYIYTYRAASTTFTKMDEHLNIINQTQWEFGDINSLIERENYLTVLGEELDHMYMKTLDSNLIYSNPNTDIGLVDIFLDETNITSIGNCFSYPSNSNIFRYHVTGLQVLIENFGSVPITSCEINAKYRTPCEWFWCSIYSTHHSSYTFPPIMPGETSVLSLPDLFLDSLRSNVELELYTTRPNRKIDKDQTNNEFKRSFLTSINSVQNQLSFTVSPTLTTDIINIESNKITNWEKANIKIITIDGKQIDIEAPQINVSALPAGVYILQCEYEGVFGSRRFVKY